MDQIVYNSEWKAVHCGDSDCWCRMVATINYQENQPYTDIKTLDVNESNILIGAGSINQNIAEYIVKLHNDALKIRNEKI